MPDEIGLYEICSDLKYDLHISDEGEIKRFMLDVVREMLRRGARVDFVWTPAAMEAYRK